MDSAHETSWCAGSYKPRIERRRVSPQATTHERQSDRKPSPDRSDGSEPHRRLPALTSESPEPKGIPGADPSAMDQDKTRTTMLVRETFKCRPPINSAPKMRNDDRATDNQADGEALENLGTGDALLGTPGEMIRDAVITPQHQGSDEAEQLLGLDVERAGLVGAGVERKEAVDDEVPFIENLDVQTRAELDEVLERSVVLVRSLIATLYGR